jgi:WD40 repeat protein
VFAKPFLASFAHDDGITCLARNPRRLNSLLSGSADGDIRLWDVPARRCLRRLVGHTGAVKGISMTCDGEAAVSCSTDCTVKLWKVRGCGSVRVAAPGCQPRVHSAAAAALAVALTLATASRSVDPQPLFTSRRARILPQYNAGALCTL